MKIFHPNRLILTIAMIISSQLAATEAIAQPAAEPEEPLVLRKIMQDMGRNMQQIADGISREDWQLVEKNALLVADHPQPPLSEKVRIMAYFNTDMSKFKSHDKKTHDTARLLSQSAADRDGFAVISDFASLQQSCLSCHQRFRKPFQQHFYGKN